MNEPLILVFDVGTQSLRAGLLNKRGEVLQVVQRRYEPPYYAPAPNRAEQRPDAYFEHMCMACQTLKSQAPELFDRVAAATLTVFRDSVLCLDAEGEPLSDCILWLDKREAEHPPQMPLWKRAVFSLVGMRRTIRMLQRASVCNWLAENEPELWAKTDKYVMLSTYLNKKITGRLADSDAAQMGHLPFDYKHRRWDKGSLTRRLYAVRQGQLCDIVPAGSVLGRVTETAATLMGLPAGLPLITAGADKGCETLGLSVLGRDKAAISFGSAASVELMTDKYFEPSPFLPSYPAVPAGYYNAEVQIYCGYWMLTWFRQNFAAPEMAEAARRGCSAEEILNTHLAEVPPGCDGLMLLPYWCAGLEVPDARGAMVGFHEGHGKYHIYRAIIEGVNFGLMEGLRRMERRSGQKIRALYVGGGGSQSAEICQITADMFGLPVRRIHTHEASSVGAAMCAYVALGEYESYEQAAEGMVRLRDEFLPDEKNHALYEQLYRRVYSRLYRRLRPLHRGLTELIPSLRGEEERHV